MMRNLYLCLLIILSGFAGYWWLLCAFKCTQIERLTAEVEILRSKNTELETVIKKNNEASDKANEQIASIKTIVKTVQSPCNCYDSRIDDAILDSVRGFGSVKK